MFFFLKFSRYKAYFKKNYENVLKIIKKYLEDDKPQSVSELYGVIQKF